MSLKNNGRVAVSQEISIPVRKGGLVSAPSVAESQEIAAATERQFGMPFDENVFLCQAPLNTVDHLDLLRQLEAEAR
jgi:hypothetical protein